MTTTAATDQSRLVVTKSDDLMLAYVSVEPGALPPKFDIDDVRGALQDEGIKITDEVHERIANLVALFGAGEIPENFPVAEGTRPQGRDERFVWSEKYTPVKNRWQEDAPVDFYSFNSILTLEKGEVFGYTEPPVPAAAGENIEGHPVPALSAARSLKLDATITRSPEDPSQLVAGVPGTVVQENDRLRIDELLLINADVSFETGNVDSTVDVHIKGHIPDRFVVRSKKSVTVGKAIDAATVSAGCEVTVCNGITGHRTGLVTAGGSITAKFCSDANLVAGGDIKIAKQAMNSQMCTGGQFRGQAASMIGGSLLAVGDIRLRHCGSQRNVITRIVTGIKPHVVRQAAQLHRKAARVRGLIERAEAVLNQLDPDLLADAAGASDAVAAIKGLIDKGRAKCHQDDKEIDTLLEGVYADATPRVYVSGTIFAGTRIRIADRRVLFNREHRGPLYMEKQKVGNVTEVVAVNTLTASVTVLKSEKRDVRTLLEGFELEETTAPPTPAA